MTTKKLALESVPMKKTVKLTMFRKGSEREQREFREELVRRIGDGYEIENIEQTYQNNLKVAVIVLTKTEQWTVDEVMSDVLSKVHAS